MKSLLLSLILSLCAIELVAQNYELDAYTQTQILAAESVFHKFNHDFNINSKLTEHQPQTNYSALDKKIFIDFAKNKLFATNPLIEIIDYNLSSTDLINRYTNRISQLLNSPNLTTDFNTYKNNYLTSYQDAINRNNARGSSRSAGQACVNIDFEDGTISGWDATFGDGCTTSTKCYNQTGVGVDGNHTIMNTPGTDPSVPALSVQSPFGGTNSFRLGDLATGNRAATISHTFLVTAGKSVFTYAFAVVMEDPGHLPEEQPYFAIDFYDQAGNAITNCGTYYVAAGAGNPGFNRIGQIEWKDWASIYIDMGAYIGQKCNHNLYRFRLYTNRAFW